MPLLIKKPTDHIEVTGTITLLYGYPGVRKTSFAFTAKKPLLFDIEGGIKRVEPKYRGDYVSITNWTELLEVTPNDVKEFDTLIFDTVGKLIDYCTDHICSINDKYRQRDGTLTTKAWTAIGQAYKTFFRQFTQMGKNIVLISHAKEEGDGDNKQIRPNIPGQSRNIVTNDADLVGFMFMDGNTPAIGFSPTGAYFGKNSCSLPPVLQLRNKTLADILSQYTKGINSESILQAEYEAQIKDFTNEVKKCKNCEDLNKISLAAQLLTKDKGWKLTARVEVIALIREKAEKLGCEMKKEGIVPKDQPKEEEQTA